jgi:hypothetical protein
LEIVMPEAPESSDFDEFIRAHDLAMAVARAAFAFLQKTIDWPAGYPALDEFRLAVRSAHAEHRSDASPDNIKPPRPSLRLVTGD